MDMWTEEEGVQSDTIGDDPRVSVVLNNIVNGYYLKREHIY